MPDSYLGEDTSIMPERSVGASIGPLEANGAYFEIYRANEVSLTSVLFSGGDWRWRFCMASGVVTASGGGFASEADCEAAVATLRRGAQFADVYSHC